MCVGGRWFTDSLVHWQHVDRRFSKRKSTSRIVFLDGKDGCLCLCRRRMIHQTGMDQHWQLTSSWHLSGSTALDPPPRVDISTQSRYPRYLRSCSCDPRLYHRQTEGLGPAPGVQSSVQSSVQSRRVDRELYSLQPTAWCLLLWSTLQTYVTDKGGLWWLLILDSDI